MHWNYSILYMWLYITDSNSLNFNEIFENFGLYWWVPDGRNKSTIKEEEELYQNFKYLSIIVIAVLENWHISTRCFWRGKRLLKIRCENGTISSIAKNEAFERNPKWFYSHTQRNLFETFLNQLEIKLYLPFSDWLICNQTDVRLVRFGPKSIGKWRIQSDFGLI